MKFLIDTQQDKIHRQIEANSDLVMGQLLTPLTNYKNWGGTFAIDNGAFSGFQEGAFKRLLARQWERRSDCLFVTCPDIVASGQRTLELFKRRRRWIPDGWKVAMVAQDGMENLEIPWDDMDAVFIGGGDPWKDSRAAADIVKTAKVLGLWVHAGRVNTARRFSHFEELGVDTCDGSGIAMYDHMLRAIARRNDAHPELPFLSVEAI